MDSTSRDTVGTAQRLTIRLTPAVLLGLLLACGDGGSSGDNLPTDPLPPPDPPPPGGNLMVGVLGCSQTSNAWRGWIAIGDGQVWDLIAGYGGGDIAQWAAQIPSGDYWQRLDANLGGNAQPTAVWWQICDLAAQPGSIADVEAMLAEIQNRLPGTSIYVSPLAEFERPETCVKQNIGNSNVLTDYLVNNGLAQRGPDLPLVLDAWIQPPQGDGSCHVGEDGTAEFGLTLAAFPWGAGG